MLRVRALLVSIGLLLIAESATRWISAGLSIGPVVGGWWPYSLESSSAR
jgi:hypothetical protein